METKTNRTEQRKGFKRNPIYTGELTVRWSHTRLWVVQVDSDSNVKTSRVYHRKSQSYQRSRRRLVNRVQRIFTSEREILKARNCCSFLSQNIECWASNIRGSRCVRGERWGCFKSNWICLSKALLLPSPRNTWTAWTRMCWRILFVETKSW